MSREQPTPEPDRFSFGWWILAALLALWAFVFLMGVVGCIEQIG